MNAPRTERSFTRRATGSIVAMLPVLLTAGVLAFNGTSPPSAQISGATSGDTTTTVRATGQSPAWMPWRELHVCHGVVFEFRTDSTTDVRRVELRVTNRNDEPVAVAAEGKVTRADGSTYRFRHGGNAGLRLGNPQQGSYEGWATPGESHRFGPWSVVHETVGGQPDPAAAVAIVLSDVFVLTPAQQREHVASLEPSDMWRMTDIAHRCTGPFDRPLAVGRLWTIQPPDDMTNDYQYGIRNLIERPLDGAEPRWQPVDDYFEYTATRARFGINYLNGREGQFLEVQDYGFRLVKPTIVTLIQVKYLNDPPELFVARSDLVLGKELLGNLWDDLSYNFIWDMRNRYIDGIRLLAYEWPQHDIHQFVQLHHQPWDEVQEQIGQLRDRHYREALREAGYDQLIGVRSRRGPR